eukprot:CAMPEP_0194542176 /NCGR_PEP_ID=MMETSP0253-20130528/83573_1 /TAXON_ID=2966 /ORGANISM="Noctiluca scintillans" /LENGTH=54 /DNA_ID=CAMNT_0039388765 /DNA_START=13 /DNA_END=173 /DNA_ORIENTATION=+
MNIGRSSPSYASSIDKRAHQKYHVVHRFPPEAFATALLAAFAAALPAALAAGAA